MGKRTTKIKIISEQSLRSLKETAGSEPNAYSNSPVTDTNKHSECNFDPIPLNFDPKSLLSMRL